MGRLRPRVASFCALLPDGVWILGEPGVGFVVCLASRHFVKFAYGEPAVLARLDVLVVLPAHSRHTTLAVAGYRISFHCRECWSQCVCLDSVETLSV